MVDCRSRMVLNEPDLLFTQPMFESSSGRILKAEPERGVRRSTTMLSTQGQGASSTPCAACKLLRRRCAQECPFSPYFSPHEPQKFASVHKVFGASNVSKMLMEVPESQRADAASSLVYEANARIRDPVYGCMGAISSLQQQAQSLQAEIAAVRQEIQDIHMHRQRVHENVVMSNGLISNGLMIYPSHQNVSSAGSLTTQTSPDYTIASPNGVTVGTSDVKDRFWSNIH